jgi:tetratricopeptide (TPR) repeat protein
MFENRKNVLAYIVSIFMLVIVDIATILLSPSTRQFVIYATLIGLAIWLISIFRSESPLRYHRILFPLSALIAFKFLMLPLSPRSVLGLELVLKDLILLLAFVFIFDSLYRIWKPKTWENTLIFLATVFSLFELALALNWYQRWWEIDGSLPPFGYRLPGYFFGHPNLLAGGVNLILPIVVVRVIKAKGKFEPPLWFFGTVIFMTSLYFTSSRAGWIAGLLGVSTTLLLIYGPKLWLNLRRRQWKSIWETLSISRLLGGLAILIILVFLTLQFFRQAETMPTHAAPTISAARSSIWGPAIEIISGSPIWGNGPGAFSDLNAKLTQVPPGFTPGHAHNILLQTAVELGLIGVGLLLWIFGALVVAFLRAWRASPDSRMRLATYAGAFAALTSHHMLDHLFQSPFYVITFFILIALMLHHTPTLERQALQKKRLLLIPGAILLIFLAGSLYTTAGDSAYWSGLMAGTGGEWQPADENICQSSEIRPAITLYGFQCSLAAAEVGFQNNDPDAIQEAVDNLEMTLEEDPLWPVHWANLAALEWTVGDRGQAAEHMEQALEAAPRNPTFALNLAWMQEASGNTSDAKETYLRALELDPWLQFGQIYSNSAAAKQALDRYLSSLDDGGEPLTIQGRRELNEGNFEDAGSIFRHAIKGNPRNHLAYAGLALVDQQSGRNDQALKNVEKALFINGSSFYVLHTAGIVALEDGRTEDTFEYFQRAFDAFKNINYSIGYYYAAYLRHYLPSDLVPQLRRGGLTTEMINSFRLLADHYDEIGEPEKALEIQNRIAVEIEGALP